MKSRKVLTILLSLAIMVTFMPTFAFAATDSGEFNANHTWDTDATHEREIVEPTCTSAGIVEVDCVGDNGLCNATHVNPKPLLGHDYVDKRFDSAADFAAALLDAKVFANEAEAANWVATYGANVCFGYAKVCARCGDLQVKTAGSNNLYGLTATEHKEPAKTKDCAASFTCERCLKENAVNSTHNKNTSATYHAISASNTHLTSEVIDGTYCNSKIEVNTSGSTNRPNYETREFYEEVTAYTCKECNQIVGKTQQVKCVGHSNLHGVDHIDLKHNLVTTTEKQPTCQELGVKVTKCADCGYVTTTSNIAKVAHDYSVDVSVPATTSRPAYTAKACSFCGVVDANSISYTGQPLSSKSSYSLELFREKSCDEAGIVKVSFTVENDPVRSRVNYLTYNPTSKKYVWFGDTTGTTVSVYTTDKDYFKGFSGGELADSDAIEIPDIKPAGHKWAKAAKVADATCLVAEQEAMTCTVCGNIKHPTTKVGKALGHEVEEIVVPSTCGTAGYSYKVCTRCNQFLDKNGKTKAEQPGQTSTAKYDEPQKYNETAPVVKLGTACQFEWATLDENTDALICKNCGAVKEGSETPKTEDAKKAAAVENAKPTIEKAADVLSNSATYTADSVKAVEEAKNNLNMAIASGTAADVKAMAAELEKAVASATEKVANAVTAKGKTIKVKAKKGKVAKNKTVKKAVKANNAAGKVTFKKANKAGGSKIVVKANGAVTVKKGLKKGTYKVAVTANAKGDGNTLAGTAKATVKVVVK
jgi:flagellar hook assembly protein FlgD